MVQWFENLLAGLAAAHLSVEALNFLGTMYPVGIIAGLVEVRAFSRTPRARLKYGLYSRASAGWIALSTLPAFASMWVISDAIIKQSALTGGLAVFVVAAGTILYGSLAPAAVELAWLAFRDDQQSQSSVPRPKATVPSAIGRTGTELKRKKKRKRR